MIPLVIVVVWVAAVITLIIQGRNKYAKRHNSKPNRV